MTKTLYIAGPMRNYPRFNFPAFDAAAARLRAAGFDVISPAEMDRGADGDIETLTLDEADSRVRRYAKRDSEALLRCTHIAMLQGWEESTGATAEYYFARWIGLTRCDPQTGEDHAESILDEATRITRGDRNEAYGHPLDEHARIAAFWSTFIGVSITAEQVAMMMVLLKVARIGHAYKRDSLVDIAGYADCCQRIIEERARREVAT